MTRLGLLVLSMVCAVLLGACGGSGTGGGAVAGTGTGAGPSAAVSTHLALQFSQCMRAHGVTNFPDPSPGSGGFQFSVAGINPQSPTFQSAQQACRRFQPEKGEPPRMTESQRRAAFTFAKCMRSHGQPEFPDPSYSPPANGPAIVLRGMIFAIGPGFDPQAPAFRRAAADCGISLPNPGKARLG